MAKVVATKAEDEELPLFGAHDHKGEYEQPEPWDHSAFEVDDRSTAERQADSIGTHRRRLEVEGYTVLPQILDGPTLEALRELTAGLRMRQSDYTDKQFGCTLSQVNAVPEGDTDDAFISPQLLARPELAAHIAHPPTLAFLRELLGEDLVSMSFSYGRQDPGSPGISIHTDHQPFGSRIFGYNSSCPATLRVLYYLDENDLDHAPFRLVPGAHLSMHPDANPYARYREHPDQRVVCCSAGDAVVLNARAFHGTMPNLGHHQRRMVAAAYRPAWAGPIAQMPEWKPAEVAQLPEAVQALFQDPNIRTGSDFETPNKPPGMRREAAGLSPERWAGSRL